MRGLDSSAILDPAEHRQQLLHLDRADVLLAEPRKNIALQTAQDAIGMRVNPTRLEL